MNDFGSRFPQPAAEWHPTRNGDVTPADVFAKSNTRYWFSCRKCGHEWMIDPASRARGRGCGACSGQVIVAGLNDLATVRPDVAAEWHPTKNGSLTPAQVTVRSETRPWWKCSRCGHEWATRVMHRTDNHGCSRCAEYGFDLASPAIVYFITHRTLGAHKVGITTYDTERLGKFTRAGWTLLHLEHVATGADAVSIETEVHRWWRDDLELPAWLTREQMRGTHGHTETISADELSEFEVISRIKQEAGRVRAAREAGLADAA